VRLPGDGRASSAQPGTRSTAALCSKWVQPGWPQGTETPGDPDVPRAALTPLVWASSGQPPGRTAAASLKGCRGRWSPRPRTSSRAGRFASAGGRCLTPVLPVAWRMAGLDKPAQPGRVRFASSAARGRSSASVSGCGSRQAEYPASGRALTGPAPRRRDTPATAGRLRAGQFVAAQLGGHRAVGGVVALRTGRRRPARSCGRNVAVHPQDSFRACASSSVLGRDPAAGRRRHRCRRRSWTAQTVQGVRPAVIASRARRARAFSQPSVR